MLDKRMTAAEAVAQLEDGMTLGIGGWATRRKPMALVREILRSDLKDLTVVSYGGPDVGLLCAAGKVKKLVFAFVSMDQIPLEPHFRNARQAGTIEVAELDEGMFHWMLRAAAMQLPFLPTRIGIGTDLLNQQGITFKTVTSPYDDGEELIAAPALHLDAALIHTHRSDEKGNILTMSPDPFFDELFCRAADKVYASTERLVSTEDLDMRENGRFALVERARITGVVEAPYGAHPTSADPDYQLDLGHLKTYAGSAESPEAWAEYKARHIDGGEAAYLEAVGGADAINALKKPAY
ncbi:MAG: CoA transferase subunit A [Sphingomonadaceae bacterium]|nr:CoA transferase subunit A [Sphingomonadaceae bacterium]